MSPKIVLTQGIPASGKSTWSNEWVLEDSKTRARVNRDDLRKSLFGTYSGLTYEQETSVTKVERSVTQNLLKDGYSVVVDAMHIRPKYIREWMKFADRNKVELEVVSFPISLDEAIKRDSVREKSVGEDVIRNIWNKYTKNGKFLPVKYTPDATPDDFETYVPDKSKPIALIVDIDGTVAHNDGHRGWYEYDKVADDLPKEEVIRVVRAMHSCGYKILFVSGRSDDCYDVTLSWLEKHVLPYAKDEITLHMRKTGDHRKDSIVKYEIFNEHIRKNFHVVGSLDDRTQVVRDCWRAMGITCMQVAEGDF